MNVARIISIISLLLPSPAYAAGLSITPARLDFTVTNAKTVSQTLIVTNPTANVLVFEVYPDEFDNVIKVQPESFTLESGGRKEVLISVKTDRRALSENTNLATTLSVTGTALAEGKVNVTAGAKIPVSITNVPKKPQNNQLTPIVIIVPALIIIVFYYYNRRRRQLQF